MSVKQEASEGQYLEPHAGYHRVVVVCGCLQRERTIRLPVVQDVGVYKSLLRESKRGGNALLIYFAPEKLHAAEAFTAFCWFYAF